MFDLTCCVYSEFLYEYDKSHCLTDNKDKGLFLQWIDIGLEYYVANINLGSHKLKDNNDEKKAIFYMVIDVLLASDNSFCTIWFR